MKYLMSQEEFEVLIGRAQPPVGSSVPPLTVVYFTATWCGACRRLDIPALEAAFPDMNWLKCDIDQNDYTAGFCGIRAIPAFLMIANQKIVDTLQHNDTAVVKKWVELKRTEAGV